MQEILEKVMEYRGSKSITDLIPIDQEESVIVKEQRVDGGYTKQKSKDLVLRCTLIGSERSPRINVLSKKQITGCKYYHSAIILKSSIPTFLSTSTKLPFIVPINP